MLRSARLLTLTLVSALSVGGAGCKKKKPPPPQPTVVQVVTVQAHDVPIYKEWIGTLAEQVGATIRAQVSGYLLTQDYAEGNQVEKGALLFQIDPRPFQALLEQARAKLAQDQAQQSRTRWNVERYAPLAKENAISQQEFNDAVQADLAAQAQVKADQAAVDAAQLNLGYTRITAPITGLAGVAQAQIGDLVGPNGPVLTTVSDINPIRVYFTVSEQAYLAYRHEYTNAAARATHEEHLTLHLVLADGSVYPQPGRFYFAGPEVSPTTGTIQIAGLFPNSGNLLRPGQFARVRARTAIQQGALVVPQRAVTELQGTYEVALVDAQNRVHIQAVSVGQQVGSDWIIDKGLQAGERVVVEGTEKVKDGMVVNPQPAAAKNEVGEAAPMQSETTNRHQ
jgi:membrane fusion protein, multidrug efflux system